MSIFSTTHCASTHLVSPTNIRQGWKRLPVTNCIDYFVATSRTNKKLSIKFWPGTTTPQQSLSAPCKSPSTHSSPQALRRCSPHPQPGTPPCPGSARASWRASPWQDHCRTTTTGVVAPPWPLSWASETAATLTPPSAHLDTLQGQVPTYWPSIILITVIYVVLALISAMGVENYGQ